MTVADLGRLTKRRHEAGEDVSFAADTDAPVRFAGIRARPLAVRLAHLGRHEPGALCRLLDAT